MKYDRELLNLGLDVLNRLSLIEDMREDIINWIYTNLINCDIDDKNRYVGA